MEAIDEGKANRHVAVTSKSNQFYQSFNYNIAANWTSVLTVCFDYLLWTEKKRRNKFKVNNSVIL